LLSGGAGGGRRGGGEPEVTSGRENETHRRCFGVDGETLSEKQDVVNLTTVAGLLLAVWRRSVDDLCGAVRRPAHPVGGGRA
jgi:hypothetical protein